MKITFSELKEVCRKKRSTKPYSPKRPFQYCSLLKCKELFDNGCVKKNCILYKQGLTFDIFSSVCRSKRKSNKSNRPSEYCGIKRFPWRKPGVPTPTCEQESCPWLRKCSDTENKHQTETSRFSSKEPNFQEIPKSIQKD